MQDLPIKIRQIVVDLGFRGVDADNPGMEIIHRGKIKSLSRLQKTWLRRRAPVPNDMTNDGVGRECATGK